MVLCWTSWVMGRCWRIHDSRTAEGPYHGAGSGSRAQPGKGAAPQLGDTASTPTAPLSCRQHKPEVKGEERITFFIGKGRQCKRKQLLGPAIQGPPIDGNCSAMSSGGGEIQLHKTEHGQSSLHVPAPCPKPPSPSPLLPGYCTSPAPPALPGRAGSYSSSSCQVFINV